MQQIKTDDHNDKEYKFILKNKLRLLIAPSSDSNLVTLGIFIKAGSRNETIKNNGIAHFLEHMMFKGTKMLPDNTIAEELDKVGAQYNALTTKEYTGYYIIGHINELNLFIDIMIDLYCNPLLNKKDIDKEKNVIIEELNMGLDDPSNFFLNKIHEKLFPCSSLGLPIIGNVKNILSFTKNDFVNFRKNNYMPSNSIMIIIANVNPEKIYKYVTVGKPDLWLNKKFNDNLIEFPNYNSNKIEKITRNKCDDNKYTKSNNSPYIYLKKNSELSQTQLAFVFRSSPIRNSFELDLVSDALSTGLSSRLFTALRIKLGITYFNKSIQIGYSDTGLFMIWVGIDNDKILETIKVVINELTKLKHEGINKDELIKIKKMRKISTSLSLKNPEELISFYAINELFNISDSQKNSIKSIINKYDDVSLENINAIIQNTFQTNNLNIFVYGKINDLLNDIIYLRTICNSLDD